MALNNRREKKRKSWIGNQTVWVQSGIRNFIRSRFSWVFNPSWLISMENALTIDMKGHQPDNITINRFDSPVVPFSLVLILPPNAITDLVIYANSNLIQTIPAWYHTELLSHTIQNDSNCWCWQLFQRYQHPKHSTFFSHPPQNSTFFYPFKRPNCLYVKLIPISGKKIPYSFR